MELQCLQEALKVEIQCHQVKTKHRFILPPYLWSFERVSGVGRGKKNLRGIKRDMFVFPARKIVCALLCLACMCVRRHKHALSNESGTLFRLLCYCRGSVSSIKN